MLLAGFAALIAVPLSLGLGIVAALHRGRPVDRAISAGSLAAISIPEFFIGYMLVYFFAVKWQMLPAASSTVYDGMPFGERMQAIALPAPTLTLVRARPHDAHDARRDPQRHAVGLYRDGAS